MCRSHRFPQTRTVREPFREIPRWTMKRTVIPQGLSSISDQSDSSENEESQTHPLRRPVDRERSCPIPRDHFAAFAATAHNGDALAYPLDPRQWLTWKMTVSWA